VKSFVSSLLSGCLAGLPALLLAGCARPEQVVPPADLLSKEVVTSILIATHLLESRIETSRLSPDSARALFQTMQQRVLQRHHVQAADSSFQHSYRYYAMHDKDLDGIYAAVIDSLTAVDKKLGGKPTPSSAGQHPY
jgi:hypothetical protein